MSGSILSSFDLWNSDRESICFEKEAVLNLYDYKLTISATLYLFLFFGPNICINWSLVVRDVVWELNPSFASYAEQQFPKQPNYIE